jgi:hypothetical protein
MEWTPSATRTHGRLRRVAFLTIYAAAVLLFFEGTSRIMLREFLSRLDPQDALYWRLHWIRQSGGRHHLYYPFDVHHPVRGWAVQPGVRDLPAFGASGSVSSNSQGARGRREYAQPKPAGVTRILAFGDSFTFGDEVPDEETYVARLEHLLPGAEVVNLGVHGYGHDQMLLYLREVGARYQPDLVMLGFVALDMDRNLLGFRDFAKPRFVLANGHLVLGNVPVPTPQAVRAHEFFHSNLADVVSLFAGHLRSAREREATREQLTAAILDEFGQTAMELGAVPVFIYLPIEGEIGNPADPESREERFFDRWAQERGVQWLDLRPYFLARVRAGAQFKTIGHWLWLEHQTAAEGIKTYLVSQGLVPAGS